jgi:hypothetical protein
VLKRLRWLVTGLAVGAGGSLWAQRKVKILASRYRPSGLAGSAATRAKGLPADVVAAIREGRAAMKQREAELRELGAPPSGRSPRNV